MRTCRYRGGRTTSIKSSSDRLRANLEKLTGSSDWCAYTARNLSQKFPGKVCLISGLWWILWFKSNALEVVKISKKLKRDARYRSAVSGWSEAKLLNANSILAAVCCRRAATRIRKSTRSTPLSRPVTSAELIHGEKSARLKLRLPYQILYRFHCNFLPVSCRRYNAAHVTTDTTAKWSTIDSYRRNDLGRKCTCQIGVTAAMGFARIEYNRPFLLSKERDAAPRFACLLSLLKSRYSAHIKCERASQSFIHRDFYSLTFEQLTSNY